MSRIPKLNMREERYLRAISAWTDERDPAAEAEIDAIIIAIQQKQAIARERAIAVRTPPLPNVRPVMPTPTASSPALPIERVAEYLPSDPRKTARPAEVQAEEDEEFPFDAATTLAPSLVPASQPLAEEEPVVRSDVEQTPNEGSEQEFVRALDLRGTKGEHFR